MNKLQLAFIRVKDFFIELFCRDHEIIPFKSEFFEERNGIDCLVWQTGYVCKKCGKII